MPYRAYVLCCSTFDRLVVNLHTTLALKRETSLLPLFLSLIHSSASRYMTYRVVVNANNTTLLCFELSVFDESESLERVFVGLSDFLGFAV